ncbi:hypothetical protein NHQ30_008448 [Ciborinia camelliae]|nr:hypothetical protein NHQ30_008448 [Ciborinia camelliae]
MFLSISTVLLVALPFSLAQSICTTSNALSWAGSGTNSGGSSSGGSSSGGSPSDITSSTCSIICGTDATCLQQCNSDTCAEQFGNDPKALQACYAAEQQGDCNILGGDACDEKRKLRARDTFTCLSGETCYEYTDGSLFCLNESTGDYVDNVGGSGNVNTGVYTEPDGSKTTVSGATAATSTIRSFGSSVTTSATRTTDPAAANNSRSSSSGIITTTRVVATTSSSSSSGTRATASTTSASSSASAASQTANSGGGKINAGSIMGVLGLVVALI